NQKYQDIDSWIHHGTVLYAKGAKCRLIHKTNRRIPKLGIGFMLILASSIISVLLMSSYNTNAQGSEVLTQSTSPISTTLSFPTVILFGSPRNPVNVTHTFFP